MTDTDHLALAKDYIARGEDFYRKAADEIVAWLAEDPTRSQRQAAERLGRSAGWINQIVQWGTSVQDPDQVDGL